MISVNLEFLSMPFTHIDPMIEGQRIHIAQYICSELSKQKRIVYSPIIHFVPIAKKFGMLTDWKYWEELCKSMVVRCSQVTLLKFDGWDQSVGVAGELEVARVYEKKVEQIDPEQYIIALKALELEYDYWVKGIRFVDVYR